MTQQTNNSFGSWRNRELGREPVETRFAARQEPDKSSRFFALRRFVFVCLVGVCFAMTLSHLLTREIVQRDAELTSQFVANIVSGHGQQIELVKILDERTDLLQLGIGTATAEAVRRQFYDHLNFVPDMQHASVYTADRKIIWSSNADWVGTVDAGNDELAQVINTREMVSTDYLSQANSIGREHKLSQISTTHSQQFFVEDYIPLFDENGSVLAVVDIYKEPKSLLDTIHHGYLLVWLSTALTVAFLYFAKFWINRRISQALEQQHLLQAEAQRSSGVMPVVTSYDFRRSHKLFRTNAQQDRLRRTG